MTNKVVFSGFLWRFAERSGAQLISFIVSIILARLLDPSDYGTIALIAVFIAIMEVFVDSGLGNALIQKKDADDIDFSTVFFANLAFCAVLYIGLFLCAPLISNFYNRPEMTSYTRVLGLTILISGIKNVQLAYISRNMLFKRFFFSTLGGTVAAAFVGISMAYFGFGVWALVGQEIVNISIDTLVLWLTVQWRPRKVFSLARLKRLYAFGGKMLTTSLLSTVYEELRQLIIGKLYSSSELAYYNRGRQFPHLIEANINVSIDSVLLPAMSNVQDTREQVKAMTRRAIKTSVYIMAPLMVGLIFIAEPLICVVLTDKWLMCVPFMRIFCVIDIFLPIQTANLNAIKAMGRSDLLLKLEIIRKIIGMSLLLSTIWFGVLALAYSHLISSLLAQIINSWPNRKLLDYSYGDQIKDILPSVLLSVFMGVCISFIPLLSLPDILVLTAQIIFGAMIYIGGSAILKLDSFQYLCGVLKSFLVMKDT